MANFTGSNEPISPSPEGKFGFRGLTKREHFSIEIFKKILRDSGFGSLEQAAEYSVNAADELIKALNK